MSVAVLGIVINIEQKYDGVTWQTALPSHLRLQTSAMRVH